MTSPSILSSFKLLCSASACALLISTAQPAWANGDGFDPQHHKWRGQLTVEAKAGSERDVGRIDALWPFWQQDDRMVYLDARMVESTGPGIEGNLGLGYRQLLTSTALPGGQAVAGAYGFFDYRRSKFHNTYVQGTVGAELLGENWDARGNVYVPETGSHVIGTIGAGGGTSVIGTTIVGGGGLAVARERALPGFDVEFGYGHDLSEKGQLWGHAGYFHFDSSETPEIAGPRLKLEYRHNDVGGFNGVQFAVGAEYQTDDIRDDQLFGIARLRIPFGGGDKAKNATLSRTEQRMTAFVERDVDVVNFAEDLNKPVNSPEGPKTADGGGVGGDPLLDPGSGDELNSFFVSNVAPGGACTQADPCTFAEVSAHPDFGAGDLVVPLGDDGDINGAFALSDPRQQIIGGGDTGALTANLSSGDTLTLTGLGVRPVLRDTLTLSQDDAYAKGFDINNPGGANNGIIINNAAADVSLNDIEVRNSTNIGLTVNGVSTLSVENSTFTGNFINAQSFNMNGTSTFDSVQFTSPSAINVNIIGGNGTTNINNSTLTQNTGQGIQVSGGHSGAVTLAADTTFTTTGISRTFAFSDADGTYNFNGTTNHTSARRGIGIGGGSSGTFTFSNNTNITTSGASTEDIVLIDGSNANVTYNGTLTHGGNAHNVVEITNNTGGSVNFTGSVSTTNAATRGVVIATNSGGTYTFADIDIGNAGSRNTTTNGVFLTNNTGGTYNFTNVAAFTDGVNAFSATSNTGTSAINIAAATLDTINNTGLTFTNSRIGTTGISLDNVTVNGGGATPTAVDIQTLSTDGGTFDIASLTTSNTTGNAVLLNNLGSTTVNMTTVDMDATVGNAISLAGLTSSGTLNVNGGTIDGFGDGIAIASQTANISNVVFGGTSAVTGNAIDINNAGATNADVTLTGNTLASNDEAVDISSTGTGTTTVTLTNNNVSSTNAALSSVDGGNAGNVVLAMSGNTFARSTAGNTIDVIGSGINSTIVTDFSGTTVTANAISGGVDFNQVTFDASGTALSGTQVTATGITQIGQGGLQLVIGNGLEFLLPTGDINFTDLRIFNDLGTGLSVDTKTGGPTTFNMVTAAGTIETTNGSALFLDPLTSNMTFGTVNSDDTITFDEVTATGGAGTNAVNITTLVVNNPTGNGIEFIDSTGNFTFGSATVNNATGHSIHIDGGMNMNVDVNGGTSTHSSGNAIVNVAGGHTGTVDFAAASSFGTTAAGTGFQFNNADGTYNFNGTNNLNGTTAGINIVNGSNGSFTFSNNSTFQNITGESVNIDGGSGNVTFGGSITQSNTSSAIDIDNKTGGIVSFNGAVTADTDSANAIDLNNNGPSTFNFAGPLDIDTTFGEGFRANNAGTLNITGATNTINSTNNTALNIVNTTIGASNVTFQRIDSSGGPSGIILNNTGNSGSFNVTGDAGTARNGSGGSIGAGPSNGIDLTNASNVNIDQMNISNSGTAGISATNVTDLVLRGITIDTPFTHGIDISNMNGTGNRIENSLIQNVNSIGRSFVNIAQSANTSTLTIQDTRFTGQAAANPFAAISATTSLGANFTLNIDGDANGLSNTTRFENLQGQAVFLNATGASTLSTNITDTTFLNANATGHGGIAMNSTDTATLNFNLDNNLSLNTNRAGTGAAIEITNAVSGRLNGTISNYNTLNTSDGRGIDIRINNTSAIDNRIAITNNIFTNISQEAIFVDTAGAAALDLTITGNDIGDGLSGASAVATAGHEAVEITARNTSSLDLLLNNNTIRNVTDASTDETVDIDAQDLSVFNATVTNNTITATGTNTDVTFEAETLNTTTTLRLDLDGNTATGLGTFELDEDGLGGTFRVEDIATVNADNTGTVNVNDGSIVDNGGDVAQPNLPTFP